MSSDTVIIILILIGLIVDIFDIRYQRKNVDEDSGRDTKDVR